MYSFHYIISVLLRPFRKSRVFYIEPMIYVDEKRQCVKYREKDGSSNDDCITDTVRFLEKFTIKARDEYEVHKKSFKFLNKKYPQYEGGIWIL